MKSYANPKRILYKLKCMGFLVVFRCGYGFRNASEMPCSKYYPLLQKE